MNSPDEQSTLRNQLLEVVETRKALYERALIGLTIIREGYDQPRVYYGLVRFLHSSEIMLPSQVFDYGPLIIVRQLAEVDEATNFISNMLENMSVKIGAIQSNLERLNLHKIQYLNSESGYGRLIHSWPLKYCEISLDNAEFKTILPTKPDLPYYPDFRDAIRDIFQLTPQGAYPRDFDIYLPDFRARIERIRVDNERILVDIQVAEVEEQEIGIKLYIRFGKETGTSKTLQIVNGTAEYSSSMKPQTVDAALILLESGELIDNRSFTIVGPPREDVIMIDAVSRIRQLVESGEGPNVEFKQSLNTSKEGEYLESITAFANTEGGFLIVGVNDNCDITGWSGDIDSILSDRISDLCDPVVNVKITKDIEVEGQLVTLVEVPEGKDKPYILRNKGVMVRIGASDRQIKRRELDRIYEEKSQESSDYIKSSRW